MKLSIKKKQFITKEVYIAVEYGMGVNADYVCSKAVLK